MSELDARYVKRGYWVNTEQGSVLGQTITTDSRTGSFIIALLAVLTSLGMTHLWYLLTFAYYQLRANGNPKDGHFRQQQALLRTLPTPSALFADSVKLWVIWRKATEYASIRTAKFTSTALMYMAVSLAAGIFSSYVATSSNVEVLVNSPHCGSLNWSASSWQSYLASVATVTESYAAQCYRSNETRSDEPLPSLCNIFTRPNIAFSTHTDQCPFNSTMCASPAVVLDSDFVDVGMAFGINLSSKEKMRYRKRSTCAMLPLEGHTKIVNGSFIQPGSISRDSLPGEEYIIYNYGSRSGRDTQDRGKNYTFSQSLLRANFSTSLGRSYNIQYDKLGPSRLGTFEVLPELQKKGADIALRLNSLDSVKYLTPINDPMFSAHKNLTSIDSGDGESSIIYKSDYPGTVMGCTLQYQFCFGAKNDTCTELGGLEGPISNATYPQANDIQLAIMSLLRNAADMADISRPRPYKAQSLNTEGIIATLPDDQWISELQGWESITWATHQTVIADFAIGPTLRDPLAISYVLPPTNEAERSLCGMQKMRKSGGFTNFNFFALIFIITISSTATIVDLVLLRCIITLSKVTKAKTPRINRWIQDGIYQLQRRAYEAQGNSVWRGLSDEIPATIESMKLPDLPIETSPVASFKLEKEPARATMPSMMLGQ